MSKDKTKIAELQKQLNKARKKEDWLKRNLSQWACSSPKCKGVYLPVYPSPENHGSIRQCCDCGDAIDDGGGD